MDDHNLFCPGFFESSGGESDTSVISPPCSSLSLSDSCSLSQSQIDLLFDNDEDDEPADTAPPAVGDISELPSLGDLSATIGELSATLMDISSGVPQTSTTDLPTIGELSATIQELSVAISEISSNSLALQHPQPVSLSSISSHLLSTQLANLPTASVQPVNLTSMNSKPVNLTSVNSQPVNLTSVNSQPVNLTSVSSDVVCLQPQPVGSMSHIDDDCQDRTAKWSGFKLVGDNIDKNF